MAAIGTDTVTSIARQFVLPEIHDQIYASNPITFRLLAAKKKMIQGGTQIEIPLMYKRFGHGGSYRGFDLLPIAPVDTIKNAVFDWKQYGVTVAVDGRTLIQTDSPDSIANLITTQFAQARMELAEHLGDGIWSDGSNTKDITGMEAAVDDGTIAATYGGITRSANTWWKSQVDSSTTTLTLDALNALQGSAIKGAKSTSLIVSGRDQYNRYWKLVQANQDFQVMAGGHDEQLASAGFTNILFNNIPWVVDSHVPLGTTTNTKIYMLNEEYMFLAVSPRADFRLEDFQTPPNQDAMVAKLLWAGELAFTNVATQAVMTAIAA